MKVMSSAQHRKQVALVRASLGLSPRERLGWWKPAPRTVSADRPSGIRR
jgi:hypothetical protein